MKRIWSKAKILWNTYILVGRRKIKPFQSYQQTGNTAVRLNDSIAYIIDSTRHPCFLLVVLPEEACDHHRKKAPPQRGAGRPQSLPFPFSARQILDIHDTCSECAPATMAVTESAASHVGPGFLRTTLDHSATGWPRTLALAAVARAHLDPSPWTIPSFRPGHSPTSQSSIQGLYAKFLMTLPDRHALSSETRQHPHNSFIPGWELVTPCLTLYTYDNKCTT